jgi:hypothetical protein
MPFWELLHVRSTPRAILRLCSSWCKRVGESANVRRSRRRILALLRSLAWSPFGPAKKTSSERSPQRECPPSAVTAPLISRGREWEQLLAAWRQACAGEPGFALITGQAIGKSRLAEELSSWAHLQGVGVAKTRSYAAEGQLSLAPVTEWLCSETVRPPLARLDTLWLTERSRAPCPSGGTLSADSTGNMSSFGSR